MRWGNWLLLVMMLILTTGFQNCAQTNFSSSGVDSTSTESGTTSTTTTTTCSTVLQSLSVPVKILFVMDVSGSNYQIGRQAGSDPDKTLRGGAVQKFFDTYSAKSNVSWGFQVFGDDEAVTLIGTQTAPQFSSTASQMQTAIQAFYGLWDSGSTPYRAALYLAYRTLSQDVVSASSDTKYIVVFVSDGVPDPAVDDATLAADVTEILGLASGRVTMNSVYYGPVNAEASARLQMMATQGQGKFLDVSQGTATFDIGDVVTVPGETCSN